MKIILLTGLIFVSFCTHAMDRKNMTKKQKEQYDDQEKRLAELTRQTRDIQQRAGAMLSGKPTSEWEHPSGQSTHTSERSNNRSSRSSQRNRTSESPSQSSSNNDSNRVMATTSASNAGASEENIRRRNLIFATLKSGVTTGVSGFAAIWGIKSLFNKEKDHTLSWCAISGGSVGLWYAFNDLKRNLSEWFC